MPRQLVDDFLAGQLLTSLVVRGKCRGQGYRRPGYNHESVRQVGGEWWGESSHSNECWWRKTLCSVCGGTGEVPLTPAEEAAFEGQEAHAPKSKRCEPCLGKGFMPGAHWPWRHPEPPPPRRKP